jgi:hypothetical protein
MKKELVRIEEQWYEKGVGFVIAHPDDETLFWGLMECLC